MYLPISNFRTTFKIMKPTTLTVLGIILSTKYKAGSQASLRPSAIAQANLTVSLELTETLS